MTTHSKFSASASHRWIRCPGSLGLTDHAVATHQIEPGADAGEAAREGTMLHNVTESLLLSGEDAYTQAQLTDEQQDAVQFCLDATRALPGVVRLYELRSTYGEAIGQPGNIAYGTADVVVVDGHTLHIGDHKFGRNYVNPEGNPQMRLYALGVLDALEALGERIDTVVMHIFQPRVSLAQPPCTMTLDELKQSAKEISAAAKAAREPWEKHLHPSEDACRYCPVKAICPALQKETMDLLTHEEPEEMNDKALSDTLAKAELIRGYLNAVEAEAMRRLTKGDPVDGFKLVVGRPGNRKWTLDDEAAIAQMKALGIDGVKVSPITPTQAISSLSRLVEGKTAKDRKAAAAEAIDQFASREPGKPKMVSQATEGTPWSTSASLEEFDG